MTISTAHYEQAHNTAPHGFGHWAIENEYGEVIFGGTGSIKQFMAHFKLYTQSMGITGTFYIAA